MVFAAATTIYGRSSPGPERPSLSVAAALLTTEGTPYEAERGSYTLRLWADNFGACSGFGQYQQPELSHLKLVAGG